MKLKHLGGIFLLSVIGFLSCTPYKQVPYFQDMRKDTVLSETINNYSPLTVQPGDILGISVTSLNNKADLMFNYNLTSEVGMDLNRLQQATVVGYLIDNAGNVNYPLVGPIKLAGLTTAEISALIQDKLQTYLTKPTVNTRILNFKISVLGDVKAPGTYVVTNERITFTEALSLAGDLNITGMRTNVMLIREKEGKREFIPVNLNSKNIINSPYYYLKNNDVIYVTPNKSKANADDATFAKLGVLLSALSIIVIVLRKY